MNGQFCTASPCQVISGFSFSLIAGAIVVFIVVYGMRRLIDVPQDMTCRIQTFTVIFGMIERAALTTIAMYDLRGAAAFFVAWTGFKLAANWNRPGRDAPLQSSEFKDVARGALTAMTGSLVSAGFALAGAFIACGKWLSLSG